VSDHEDEMQVDIPNLDLTSTGADRHVRRLTVDTSSRQVRGIRRHQRDERGRDRDHHPVEPSDSTTKRQGGAEAEVPEAVVGEHLLPTRGFYGSGAIEPVESLITEMKEHHDLYLDEHKRSVMPSCQFWSGPVSHHATWNSPRMPTGHAQSRGREAGGVPGSEPPGVHGGPRLIDREIDRTAGASTMMQGYPTTKRQTGQETQMLMAESAAVQHVYSYGRHLTRAHSLSRP